MTSEKHQAERARALSVAAEGGPMGKDYRRVVLIGREWTFTYNGYDNPEDARQYFPVSLRGGLERWITKGIMPGDFLKAVLENNLSKAIGRADETNIKYLPGIVTWLYNRAPSACWGSRERVQGWQTAHMAVEAANAIEDAEEAGGS